MRINELEEEEIISEINLTPLVDISLVLVIIFMVVAPFLSHILRPLLLPSASQAALTDSNTIKVSVFPDGDLAVGQKVVKEEEIGSAIGQEIASGKNPWVLLRAGSDVDHGRVMRVLKEVRKSGIERIAFAAKMKEETVKP